MTPLYPLANIIIMSLETEQGNTNQLQVTHLNW
jgi:hypothetical protein